MEEEEEEEVVRHRGNTAVTPVSGQIVSHDAKAATFPSPSRPAFFLTGLVASCSTALMQDGTGRRLSILPHHFFLSVVLLLLSAACAAACCLYIQKTEKGTLWPCHRIISNAAPAGHDKYNQVIKHGRKKNGRLSRKMIIFIFYFYFIFSKKNGKQRKISFGFYFLNDEISTSCLLIFAAYSV